VIIVVKQHDNGWLDHSVVRGDRVVLADLFGSLWSGWTMFDKAREVRDGEHIDEYSIRFERFEDPVEVRLLDELDVSAMVYADWLDEHGRPAHAEMLRLQLAALTVDPLGPALAPIEARLNELAADLPYGWMTHVTRPIIVIGDELTFRIGVRRRDNPNARMVQIWAGPHHQTPVDDSIYVPQFVHSLRQERDMLVRGTGRVTLGLADRGKQPPWFTLFDHGPTTDAMSCAAIIEDDELVLEFRETTIRMPLRDYLELLDRVIAVLG
jgi:hypothetical protein